MIKLDGGRDVRGGVVEAWWPRETGVAMLVVVRHADAGDKQSWEGPDALRPLSPAGHRQAEGLVIRMEDYPVERILCSPTVRCLQTVEPLARAEAEVAHGHVDRRVRLRARDEIDARRTHETVRFDVPAHAAQHAVTRGGFRLPVFERGAEVVNIGP